MARPLATVGGLCDYLKVAWVVRPASGQWDDVINFVDNASSLCQVVSQQVNLVNLLKLKSCERDTGVVPASPPAVGPGGVESFLVRRWLAVVPLLRCFL